ncbi:type IV secretion system protein [Candidatus Enterovibrio escicola]|uniref:type IV secretion system protein n=1 Tax=Candidatus Enterovibrio escicola TaxID=1927127 RepID=UPI001237A1FF|nr:type IV secretion system protein [Candidatus Enterovibrio escacola]
MDMGAFQYIGTTLDNLTSSFVLEGAQNLMAAIKPIVITCVTIHLMGHAYLQIAGKTDDLAIDVVKTCVTVISITTLTLNVGNYTNYIVEGVHALGEGLANGILPNNTNKNIYYTLDGLLKNGVEKMIFCWDKGGWKASSWVWFICGLIIVLSITILTIMAAIIIIGTKFLLSILLVVGPLFMIMACFPLTRRFLDSWMGKILENLLVQLFGIAIVYMVIELVENFLRFKDVTSSTIENPGSISMQIAVISAISTYVIRQIPNLAGSLAGGFSSALLALPKVPKLQSKYPNQERIKYRQQGTQQQNQISGGGTKTGSAQKNDISQDLRDRIAEHNLRNT